MDADLEPVARLIALELAGEVRDPLRVGWLISEAIATAPGMARCLAVSSMERGAWSPVGEDAE